MDPLQPGATDPMFTIVPVLIGVIFAVGIGITIYRGVRMANRGVNPLTLREDLAAKALQSEALRRPRTKAERLDELDSLRALGRITEEELLAARAQVLRE